MKTLFRFVISSLVMLICLNISIAQDEDTFIPYPPITPDNASQLQMIQVLSKGTPRAFSWSPDSTQLAITAEGGTWIYDVTQEDMPSYWVKEHDLSPRIVYAPNHDIYISFESLHDCEHLDCTYGQKIFVRSSITNEILYEIDNDLSPVIKFSPDGELLAVATYFGDIRIWETQSFLTQADENPDDFMICKISTIASPFNITFSPDSSLITYSAHSPFRASPADHSLWFWDTHTCELKLEIPVMVTNQPMSVPFNANFVAYSRDGHYLIVQFTSDYDGHGVYLWDMVAFENLGKLSDLFSGSFLSFGFEGNTILFREDGIIKERDIESKTVVNEYQGDNVIYLDDGTTLIQRDKKYYRLTEEGEQPFIPYGMSVNAFHVSSNQEWLLTYHTSPKNNYRVTLLWNLQEERFVKLFKAEYSIKGFTPNDTHLLLYDRYSGLITSLNLETLEEKFIDEYRDIGDILHWSKSENILVSYGDYRYDNSNSTNLVDVWKYNGTEFQRIWGQPSENNKLKALSDDFIIIETQDAFLEFYRIATGELVIRIPKDVCDDSSQHQNYCNILANPCSEDNYQQNPIVRLSDDRQSLEVIDRTTNTIIATYPTPIPNVYRGSSMWRFNDNGDLLLATQSKLYNLSQNTLLVDMPRVASGTRNCGECETTILYYEPSKTWLSDDLNFLISIEAEDPIPPISGIRTLTRVWDIQTNQEIYNLVLYRDIGASLAPFGGLSIQFTPDMRWLFEFRFDVPNSGMQTIYYRDLNIYNGLTGEQVVTLPTFNANAYDAQFSPDNRFLITSSDTLRVWAVVPEDNTP